jgi:uncharacterized iron-regulated membrane protein
MPPRIYTVRPPTNPILQVLYFLVGVVLLIGAVFMGAVILAVVLGLAVIFGIVIYIRVWWLKRKFARAGRGSTAGPSKSNQSEVIEVEYTVIDERDERDD